MYNIIKARVYFENDEINSITVLVQMSNNDIRAFRASRDESAGYMRIPSKADLDQDLLQEVAANGVEVEVKKYFPSLTKDN